VYLKNPSSRITSKQLKFEPGEIEKMKISLVILLLAATSLSTSADRLILSENGRAKAEIVIGNNPSAVVKFAATELADFLGRAGTCKFSVVSSSSAPVRIYLGDSEVARAAGLKPQQGEIIISARSDGAIYILGFDDPDQKEKSVTRLMWMVRDKGTLEGVYHLLEKYFGIRWVEPGKEGEYVPKTAQLEIPIADERVRPAFQDRRMYHFDGITFPDISEYCNNDEELLLWGLRLRSSSWTSPVFGCHPVAHLPLAESFATAHPDWFALQADGKRNFKYLCWTNPEVIDFWVKLADAFFSGKTPEAAGVKMNYWNHPYINPDEFMIDPNDMYEKFQCRCERCRKFIEAYPNPESGLSELLYRGILEAARRIGEKYPDKTVTTLAYPPKQQIPKTTDIPRNLKIRFTTLGPNHIVGMPQGYSAQLELLKNWSQAIHQPVPLWIYVDCIFANGMTGPPEIVVHNFQRFLKDIRPWSSGMFVELEQPTHTVTNLNIYAGFQLLWNPDLDLEPLLDEYFTIMYGSAGPAMKAFFGELERNWNRILQVTWTNGSMFAPEWYTSDRYRKIMWKKVYTSAEINRLEKMLEMASKQVQAGSVYAKRINRVDRRIVEFMKSERAAMMEDNAPYRQRTVLHVRKIKGKPTENDWNSVPWIQMVSAENPRKKMEPSRFKVLASEENFYLRGEFSDSKISDSLTRKDRRTDDWSDLWDDNEVEVFFYSTSTGYPVQILINDRGFFAVNRMIGEESKFSTREPVTVKAAINARGWTLDAVFPNELTGLSGAGDNRFNLIRARNVKDAPREYSTWSPEAIKGKWIKQNYYGQINYITTPPKNVTPYSGQARKPAGDAIIHTAMSFSKADITPWFTWVNPGGKSKFSWDSKNGRQGKGSLLIDMRNDSADGKDPGASWLFIQKHTPGTQLRLSAWGKSETTNPNAVWILSAGWQNKNRQWVKYGELLGSVNVPAIPGEWQFLSMDIEVPTGEDVEYLLLQLGSGNAFPGKVWFDDVSVEIVK
jgi:hypothetical protein